MGLGRFAILADLEGGRAFKIAGDGQIDHCFWKFGVTYDDGVVGFVGFAVLELFAKHFLGFGIFS